MISAALVTGCDAIHPGYGFLSEDEGFAEVVRAHDLTFIGPPAAVLERFASKESTRRLLAAHGLPTIPGSNGILRDDIHALDEGERIGYPILVKPAAGGGGKGMRTVREPDRLLDALAAARREATAAFADDRLILERLIEGGRHVEIQVLFDADGNGVHLGERDCSIQRRHQKVLEESPSPAVDAALRARLGDAALTLARAVGYVSAGTCEFLVDDHGDPAFLEMNTRLQVEHPVTELVTGRDLVADQLRIAAGEPLALEPDAARPTGHAVEVRLYAEDAEDGFLPATGRIEALRWPTGDGIRVDAGVALGSEIGARFDPMLAKVIVWGPDRATAFDRLARALDASVVLGVVTNLRFLRWLLRQPVVLDGQARTDVLHRIWPPDAWAAMTEIPDESWAGAAASLVADPDAADPWAGAWRLNAARSVRVESDGVTRSVEVSDGPTRAGLAFASVRAGDTVHLDLARRSVPFRLAAPPDVDAAARAAASHGLAGWTGPAEVTAPMPGAVLTVHVATGQAVAAGDPIVTLEAMKMEHVVVASIAGRVGEVRVRPADQVTRSQLLAVIEP
jgi:acetyl-CoA/propionyl-CoA carboxylase biotin carboxyl carrier protein